MIINEVRVVLRSIYDAVAVQSFTNQHFDTNCFLALAVLHDATTAIVPRQSAASLLSQSSFSSRYYLSDTSWLANI